MQQMRLLLQH
jgi:hypothetical protein